MIHPRPRTSRTHATLLAIADRIAALVVCLAAVIFAGGGTASASPTLDRSTPRQTVSGLLRVTGDDDGDAKRSSHSGASFLQLDGVSRKSLRPAEAAERLAEVLRTRLQLDISAISDTPAGNPDDGDVLERIGEVSIDDDEIPITLTRVTRNGQQLWLFSAATVARIPDLSRAIEPASWVTRIVPATLRDVQVVGLWPWQWFGLLLAVVLGLPMGYGFGRCVTWSLGRVARKTRVAWDDMMIGRSRATLRFFFTWLVMGALAASLQLPAAIDRWVELVARTPLIFAAGWLLRTAVLAVTGPYLSQAPEDAPPDRRGLRTQIVILRRLSTAAIVLITFGVAMMQLDIVRNVGLSLLASAGVAGVAIGLAAQRSLGDVISGLQLSMTQPVRLGDTVVIAGEWGTVEEITLTFVRLKLWDERRLIVPIEKVLHEVFENWSVPGDGILGIIEIPIDPTAPVALLRDHFESLVRNHPAHDGREWVLQVTDLSERRALLRGKVSTSDIAAVFPMRCDLRESMMQFLQDLEGGRYLARGRWENVDAAAD